MSKGKYKNQGVKKITMICAFQIRYHTGARTLTCGS